MGQEGNTIQQKLNCEIGATSHPSRGAPEFQQDFRGRQTEGEASLCVLLSISRWMWPASEDRHNGRASGTAPWLREMVREGPSNGGKE